jgi:para-aminobenzoate synthetase component 1
LSLRCDAQTLEAELHGAEGRLNRFTDPLAALRWMERFLLPLRRHVRSVEGPPFKGGWTGFLSYDFGRLFESLPEFGRRDLQVPLFDFQYYDKFDAQDAQGQLFAVDLADTVDEQLAWTNVVAPLNSPLISNFTPEQYRAAVERVIEYIRAGDVFQVNLSQRFSVGQRELKPAEVYRDLLARFPAWYGAFLDRGDYALLCNSPELFLRITPGASGRTIMTRPIKGTRPRGPSMRDALLHSGKDQAELNMIVDLERNDLGRICRIGSVRVIEPRVIEEHPTVYHGAASIEGVLREEIGLVDLLRATFPGGSVTGAPKIRAMEIIEEIEPVRRGPYCGAIGYISIDGHIEFNVAIRTIIFEGGRIHIPVGGGIVADSDPTAEYEETLVKARAMFAALGVSAPR